MSTPVDATWLTVPADDTRIEKTGVRVTYRDTDQMGHSYYANYLVWMEMGRTEWLRTRGGTYRELELADVFLPVKEVWCDYERPARYDDWITVWTWVCEARRASLRFAYEIRCEERGERLARGMTLHPFVNSQRRIVAMPPTLSRIVKP